MCGIAMINIDDYPLFASNRSTLKETSKDDSNTEYMTESEMEVINFDKVKEDYVKNLSVKGVASLDTLAVYKDRLELIEFKNGCLVKREKEEKLERIGNKIRDSLLLFCDIVNKNISHTRNHVDFILVYNEFKNPITSKEIIALRVTQRGGGEFIRFGLEGFEGLYFRDVHTYTEKQFKAHLGEA